MRIFGLVCLIAALMVVANAAPSALKNDLKSDEHFVTYLTKVITLFKKTMTKGIKSLKIPPTEPLVVPKIDIQSHGVAELTGGITKLTVKHLSEFKVNNLEANLAQLYAKVYITVPRFEVTGNYQIKGFIGHILPIEGHSTFLVSGKNVTVGAKILLKQIKDKIQCTDFKIDIDVSSKGFKLEIHKLYDDPALSKVISEVFTDSAVKLYKNFKSEASGELRKIVMKALNEEMGKQSFKDIISGKVIPLPFKTG